MLESLQILQILSRVAFGSNSSRCSRACAGIAMKRTGGPAMPVREVIGLAHPDARKAQQRDRRLGWLVCPHCDKQVTFRSSGGVVKAWFPSEGYGYITPDDGSGAVYFDRRACGGGSEVNIPEGDRVTYTEQWNKNIPKKFDSKLAGYLPLRGAWQVTSVDGLWKVGRKSVGELGFDTEVVPAIGLGGQASSSRKRSRSRPRRGLSSLGGRRSRSLPATDGGAARAAFARRLMDVDM